MLRVRSKEYKVPLLGYCVTSNHVHLLVQSPNDTGISKFMNALQGDFAQRYNLRKKRSGAFWGNRYHATAIGDREQLWNCLIYIELNMVRAGVISHPSEWTWSSYRELTGTRQRYRLLDPVALQRAFGSAPHESAFQERYLGSLDQKIREDDLKREKEWSESLAVGDEAFIEKIQKSIYGRERVSKYPTSSSSKGWVLHEKTPDYA